MAGGLLAFTRLNPSLRWAYGEEIPQGPDDGDRVPMYGDTKSVVDVVEDGGGSALTARWDLSFVFACQKCR